jgi:hypothetical protein
MGHRRQADGYIQAPLTQKQADELIRLLKKTLEEIVRLPRAGERHKTFAVVAENRTEQFRIHPYQGVLDPAKHQITALLSTPRVRLMRLCVNGHPHRNPDRQVIGGTHLHVYREGYADHYAIPITVDDPDFAADTMTLLEKFHVTNGDSAIQGGLE